MATITPRQSVYIAGHKHNRKSKGTHDDLYAKAVVIQRNKQIVALLTLDCIGLLHPQLLEIRQAVKQKVPQFPVDHIVLSSTHTHSGPDVVGLWGKHTLSSGVNKTYLRQLVATAAQTIVDAWRNRKPATTSYAVTAHGEGWVQNISEPAALDRALVILRFADQQGRNIATLCNFACHPTFLDGSSDQLSADFVGGYYKHMDAQQGGVNLFLQGAIGGWIQPEHEAKTFEQAFLRGKGLAEAALTALQSAQALRDTVFVFRSRPVAIPLANAGLKQLAKLGVINLPATDSVRTEVAYFRLGEAHFATHPGETVPDMSLDTKAMMPGDGPKFILGLGMDALGYILKPSFFAPKNTIPHSEYLCSVSVGPAAMEKVMGALRGLIR